MRLYPINPVKGQSFIGVKKVVVPMQSMSLQEIVKRFVRNEALPLSKDAVYNDIYDIDLEKLAHEDLTVKEEILTEYKQKAIDLREKHKKEKADHQSAMQKAAATKRAQLLAELNQTLSSNSGIGGNASNGPRETEPRR